MITILKRAFLILIVFVLIPLNLCPDRSYGASGSVFAEIIDGEIVFNITSTAASNAIRYRTIGWTVRRDRVCEKDSKGNKTQCNPKKDNNYVTFEGSKEVKQIKQVPPNPKAGETVVTYFSVPESLVSDGLRKNNMGEVKDGDEVFLSSVMISIGENDNKRSGPWYTLQGIKKAEGWAHEDDLDDYFDVRAIYHSAKYPVKHVYVKEGKQNPKNSLKEEDVDDFKLGQDIRFLINGGNDTFKDKNNKEYTIVKSYLLPMRPPSTPKFEQLLGSKSLFERNFTVDLGGTYIVSVWKEKCDGKGGEGCGSQGEGSGDCTYSIGPPRQVAAPKTEYMDPGATGVIQADNSANDRHFDAVRAIPTSENLYANAWGMNYLFQHTFGNMQGEVRYVCKVNVTYPTKWEEKQPDITGPDGQPEPQDPIEHTGTLKKTYNFELTPRQYAYWQINQLEVYEIDQAEMRNYALPGGKVTLYPDGYDPPAVDLNDSTDVEDHVYPKETGTISFTPEEIDGGEREPTAADVDDTEALKAIAESQTGDADVQNDYLSFNGKTIMDDAQVSKSGPTPSQIPAPERIGDRVLYEGRQFISSILLNKANTISTGTIYYSLLPENVNGSSDKEYPINGINTVTVHTPVVNYSSVTDDQAHNQKTIPNEQRAAFILERPFTVTIPTSGQHLNEWAYPGYGNRDYAKYYRTKQVLFPFDVYNENRTQFIPKSTWIDIPVDQLDTTFYLPVWVDEGDYQVYFRNIAENAPYDYTNQGEPNANLNLIHHIATDEKPVEVIGRLYDFEITDIADYNWESVFRTRPGSPELRGISYWIGQKKIDGDPRGNKDTFTLSIRPGSNPLTGYKNIAIKTGYHFKFDFKTKGNMFGKLDGIRITPKFYFVGKKGGTPQEVDLYYKTNNRQFVKIGSNDDQVKRYVILNDRLRNVPTEELKDTASYKYDKYNILSQLGNPTKPQYEKLYFDKLTKQKTPVGGYSLLLFPEQLRTFIGPKTEIPPSVDVQRANVAIQKWYGEYSLPANPYVVTLSTNIAEYGRTHGGLDDKSPIFLRDGYIVVNFNIESIQEGKLNDPHLQYIKAPMMNKWKENQWQMEGFQSTVRDSFGNQFELKQGDVVFYHADKSSRDDFSSQVPH